VEVAAFQLPRSPNKCIRRNREAGRQEWSGLIPLPEKRGSQRWDVCRWGSPGLLEKKQGGRKYLDVFSETVFLGTCPCLVSPVRLFLLQRGGSLWQTG
jgi:hypothetical protein